MKNIFKLLLFVLAIATVFTMFTFAVYAAEGDVVGGHIYLLDKSGATKAKTSDGATQNVWQYNYHAFPSGSYTDLTALEYLYAHDTEGNRIDSGLLYDFDATAGKLTIYAGPDFDPANIKNKNWGFPNEYMKVLVANGDDENGNIKYFERAKVKEVLITAEGMTTIPEQSFNQFAGLTKITIPESVNTLENYSLSRNSKLQTVAVYGKDNGASYVVDLRGISYSASNTFSESFQSGSSAIPQTLTFYLGAAMCAQPAGRNISFGIAGDDPSNTSSKKGTGNIVCYTPTGESCPWIDDIAKRAVTQWSLYPSYYDVTVFSYPYAVKELGYQVRIKDYNGLRAIFKLDEESTSVGHKIIEHGQLLETPIEVPMQSKTLVEFGTIASTYENIEAFGYELVKDGTDFVTTNSSVKKVAVSKSNLVDGKFCVSIVNFKTKDQMTKPIFMCGYEIWLDSATGEYTVSYSVDSGTHCAPCSLYDASIGMYRNGLINSSTDKDNIVWNVVEDFKLDVEFTELAKTYVDANGVYPWASIAGGELVYKGNSEVTVFLFESTGSSGNKVYTAIARGTGSFDGGTRSINYIRENFLSESFIGVPIDTIVVDEGITAIAGAVLSGWSEYYNESKGADFHTSLTTIILAKSVKKLTSQTFHSDSKISNIITFDAELARTNPSYVADNNGTVDLSNFDASQITNDIFNRCAEVITVILPAGKVALTQRMFMQCTNLTKVYTADVQNPADHTATIGGWMFNLGTYDQRLFDSATASGVSTGGLQVFEGATGITKVIASNGTFNRVGTSMEWTLEE